MSEKKQHLKQRKVVIEITLIVDSRNLRHSYILHKKMKQHSSVRIEWKRNEEILLKIA